MGCCYTANFTFTVLFYVNPVTCVFVTLPDIDVTYMAATSCNKKSPSSVFLGLRDFRLLNSVNEFFDLLGCFAALIGCYRRFGIVNPSHGQGQAVKDQSTNAVAGYNSCLVWDNRKHNALCGKVDLWSCQCSGRCCV
jgi:hypothetical protein